MTKPVNHAQLTPKNNHSRWRNRITRSGTLKVAEALANPLNFRLHPPSQRNALATSLSKVGWVQQVVVNERSGHLIDGHLRLFMAEQNGESELPCLFVDLTDQEERVVLASLDPITALAAADHEKFSELLESIDDRTGFEELLETVARLNRVELSDLNVGLTDPDEVPEVPDEPVTQLGDIWQLGEHRLLCGDATSPDAVTMLMGDERAVLMATDPPYGVGYDGGNHPRTWGRDGRRITAEEKTKHWRDYDDAADLLALYRDFLTVAQQCALAETPVILMFFAMMRAPVVFNSWQHSGLLLHQICLWHKSRTVLSHNDFCFDYEPLAYGWVAGRRPPIERRPPANATTTWDIPSAIEDGASGLHPTQKPVEVFRRPLLWHTRPGEVCYEPFAGSGTTIIAAELTSRRCYALEIAPHYVDVCVARWERFTGQKAVRLTPTGLTP